MLEALDFISDNSGVFLDNIRDLQYQELKVKNISILCNFALLIGLDGISFASVVLLSSKPVTTLKYLIALAKGIPCVHYYWILHCVRKVLSLVFNYFTCTRMLLCPINSTFFQEAGLLLRNLILQCKLLNFRLSLIMAGNI